MVPARLCSPAVVHHQLLGASLSGLAFQLCDTSLKRSTCDPILGIPRASPCVLQVSRQKNKYKKEKRRRVCDACRALQPISCASPASGCGRVAKVPHTQPQLRQKTRAGGKARGCSLEHLCDYALCCKTSHTLLCSCLCCQC